MQYLFERQLVEQLMKDEFSEAAKPDGPDTVAAHRERTPVVRRFRLRLSTALHTLASAIEPARTPTMGTPSPKH